MALYIFITTVVVAMGYFVNGSYRTTAAGGARGRRQTCVASRQEFLNKILLVGIFTILFALSALRIGIGNDYWTYRQQFLYISGGDRDISYEIGFQWLVRLMQALFGQDNYRTTFATVAFLTCAFSLKGIYDTADWFVFSFFLFMTNGFYFMSFSTVRYYLALAFCLYSVKYLLGKQYLPFVLWVILAALFHKTALLVIPAYLVAYYLKWSKKTLWMIPAACVVLVVGKPVIRRLLFLIYPFYEGDSILDVGAVSYVNIAKCAAILVLCLLFYKADIRDNAKNSMFFNLNLFALILYSCGSYIPELTRICYYMVIGQIFLLPPVLQSIQDRKMRRFFCGAVIAAYICYFVMFLIKGKSDYVMILPYLTWIFV